MGVNPNPEVSYREALSPSTELLLMCKDLKTESSATIIVGMSSFRIY